MASIDPPRGGLRPPAARGQVRRRVSAAGSGKRLLLGAIGLLMSAAALLAIAILLLGDFGETELRILGTTALVAAYALAALPAALLYDQRRLPALAAILGVLAFVGAVLHVAATWSTGAPDALGKSVGTLAAWTVATAQVAALAAWRGRRRGRAPRALYVASTLVVAIVAALFTALLWGELESERLGRVFGALLVLDVLLVALQPLVARARRSARFVIRAVVDPGGSVEVRLEAPDLASAAAAAIRRLEREGRQVQRLDLGDGAS